jgi:hypothetical protein
VRGRRSEFIDEAARAGVFLPTSELAPANRTTGRDGRESMRGEGGATQACDILNLVLVVLVIENVLDDD